MQPSTVLRGMTLSDNPYLTSLRSATRNFPLRSFQVAGAEWMVTVSQGLLADDMGTGKTVQTCAAWWYLTKWGAWPFPALVVCPNSVKDTWRRTIAEWLPQLRVQVVTGGMAARRKALAEDADVYVINYEAVRLHSRLAPYGTIALSDKEKTPGDQA